MKDQTMAMAPEVDQDEIKKYDVEDALRTILKAEEHKRNPKLMAKVKELATNQHKDLTKVAQVEIEPKDKKPKSLKEMRQMANDMDGDE